MGLDISLCKIENDNISYFEWFDSPSSKVNWEFKLGTKMESIPLDGMSELNMFRPIEITNTINWVKSNVNKDTSDNIYNSLLKALEIMKSNNNIYFIEA